MKQIIPILAAAVMLALPVASQAQDRPVVVELFTSQGCSSCPPADAFMEQLAARGDVIALSLHVDYWDYIGWADIFAKPEHTARQRGYAKSGDRRMVYTPQMIINGKDHVVGNRPRDVTELIEKHRSDVDDIVLKATRDGNLLRITARTDVAQGMPMLVQLLRYRPEATVAIERGENAGKVLKYSNIVTEMIQLAVWDSSAPLKIDTRISGDDPLVVLLQYPDFGTIEAAVELP
ncbi:hypothetical protein SAMN05444414_10155 [Roseovarius marisflavi]|uniref:DUF1223 domain-containing protein n=1 Tax=Roseovarius marisflavi TaxID=1054996 RepID=A0A1M6V1Y7_9RHOB|nr:DUF1223 domain-containing protein [Roseovarius marisflavi]SHK75463.1 hypothetical protein SAMN05444414_10155 [Roseovarius marisflavi]